MLPTLLLPPETRVNVTFPSISELVLMVVCLLLVVAFNCCRYSREGRVLEALSRLKRAELNHACFKLFDAFLSFEKM
jgi:hypothetical protein